MNRADASPREAAWAAAAPVARTFETAGGLRLNACEAGPADGPVVVLLHGGGQTLHSWAVALVRLAGEGYRAISYDSRGHGESDWSPEGDYSFPSLAADLEDVIRDFPGPIALVGASMGGLASFLSVGHTRDPRIGALVLVDVVLAPAPAGVARIREFMSAHGTGFATLEEAAATVAAYNPHRRYPPNPEGLRRNLREGEDGRLRWHWDPRLLDNSPNPELPTYVDQMMAISSFVTVPTLLVRGGQSDVVSDEGVSDLLRLVPQTEIADVPGSGHMVAGDRNDAFVDAVLGFLRVHMPAGAGR